MRKFFFVLISFWSGARVGPSQYQQRLFWSGPFRFTVQGLLGKPCWTDGRAQMGLRSIVSFRTGSSLGTTDFPIHSENNDLVGPGRYPLGTTVGASQYPGLARWLDSDGPTSHCFISDWVLSGDHAFPDLSADLLWSATHLGPVRGLRYFLVRVYLIIIIIIR